MEQTANITPLLGALRLSGSDNKQSVRTHGGENLGYVPLPDMGDGGLREFAQHYDPNRDKDGMVYDVRTNGVRSWGGLVGSGGGYPLIDGGRRFIPNYGAWSPAVRIAGSSLARAACRSR